jgi:hypothetical protein
MPITEKEEEPLSIFPTRDVGTSTPRDAVFGELHENGPNYRNAGADQNGTSLTTANGAQVGWM